jgi:hypothetical protein
MRHVEVVPATMEHAGEILPRVRQADADEFYATARFTPALALDIAIHHSTHRWAGIVDGLVVAIFGASNGSLLTGTGVPWLISSNEVEHYPMTFLRHSRPLLTEMLRDYRLLENWADVRNVKACCWLRWMGFQFDAPAPFGVLGLPFYRFEMRN